MKLKKISQLCNREKTCVIYDKTTNRNVTTQWLGDGRAAYPLDGLPLLDEDTLCRMFDIPQKRREKMSIRRIPKPDGISMDDTVMGEYKTERMEPGIIHGGRNLIPLMGRKGIIFIQEKYLSPLEDEGGIPDFHERETPAGQSYIAVKMGMWIRAVIFPVEPAGDELVKQLGDLQRECKRVMDRRRQRQEEEGIFQLTWTEEEPDGDTP